jgi:hypothetical protein
MTTNHQFLAAATDIIQENTSRSLPQFQRENASRMFLGNGVQHITRCHSQYTGGVAIVVERSNRHHIYVTTRALKSRVLNSEDREIACCMKVSRKGKAVSQDAFLPVLDHERKSTMLTKSYS